MKVIVLEVNVIFLFGEFVDLAEVVHVQLSDEGGCSLVSEEIG